MQRAGAAQPHQLPANLDLEQFRTVRSSVPDSACLGLTRIDGNAQHASEFHPKSYLHYLCDPTLADRQRRYRETVNGVAALRVA